MNHNDLFDTIMGVVAIIAILTIFGVICYWVFYAGFSIDWRV